MKFKIILLFQFLILTLTLSAQSDQTIAGSLGLNGLSEEGKAIIGNHYREDKYLFTQKGEGTEIIFPLTMKIQIEKILKDKLSETDFILLSESLDKKVALDKEKQIDRGVRYEFAMECQKSRLDSLRTNYYPKLKSYKKQLSKRLGKKQIELIRENYDLAVQKLRSKGFEFIQHEERISKPYTSSVVTYMKLNFKLMEEIPTTYYFNLVGSDIMKMDFLNDKKLAAYFQQYQLFEDEVLEKFSDEECKPSVIPFYYSGERYLENYRKKNAIFFAIKNILD